MRSLVTLFLLGSTAHADVTGEILLGAGGDRETATGLAAANGEAVLVQIPEVSNRAVECNHAPELGTACMWLFTGVDPRATDEIGASASGRAWLDGDHAEVVATTRAWARGAGWGIEERVSLQPTNELRDRIWLSGRGVIAARTLVDFAPMFALGGPRWRGAFAAVGFEVGQRWRDGQRDPGHDWVAKVNMVRVFGPTTEVRLFGVRIADQRIDEYMKAGHTYGISAFAIDFEGAALDIHDGGFTLTSRIGFTDQTPVYHSVYPATPTSKPVPHAMATDYAVDASFTTEHGFALGAGLGSWLRLLPDAASIDYGQIANAFVALPQDDYTIKLKGSGGFLDRVGGSPFMAPPPRTRSWMGRVDAEVAWRVTEHLDLLARVWGERSDRDDLRWAEAPHAIVTRIGADLTARLH